MTAFRSSVLLFVTALLLAVPAQAQEYKETFNDALETAKAGDYATARAIAVDAATGADGAGDAETARRARYLASQLDNRLGNAALRADDNSGALAHFNNGVAIFPDYIKNQYGAGLALKRLGRMDDALEQWSGITDNTQDRETARTAANAIRDHFYHQASSAVSKSNPTPSDGDRALAALDASVDFVEPNDKFYLYTAIARLAKGENEASIAAADQALALHRGSRADAAAIHFTRGEALLRTGNVEDAKAAFENSRFGSYRQSAEHYLSTL